MSNRTKTKRSASTALLLGCLALLILAVLLIGLLARRINPKPEETEPLPSLAVNPFEESDFYEEDGFIYCSAADAVTGVDVSEHQGVIDWEAVARSGIDFAFIRAGYRGTTDGGLYMDSMYYENMDAAIAAGLDVGVYFYSQAISPAEAKAEACLVLAAIDGYDLAYPVVYDWEFVGYDYRTGNMTSEEVTACVDAFCGMIESEGFRSAFYFNQDLASHTFRLEELGDYDFWLAQYNDAMTFYYDVDLWQYSCSGSVPGINTNVDLNLSFTSYKKAGK